ncbi:MAG: thiol reductant ABC exporter subunit CydD [Ignavibacteriales bacterium]|nr:thiol reductant ABC exporter subunit CydD [Ignavibacteriales bacterium]
MNFSKELFSEIKPVRINFILVIFFGLLAAVTTILLALSLSKIINGVFLSKQTLQDVSTLIVIFIALALVKSLLSWCQHFFSTRLVSFIKKSFRKKLLIKIEEIGPLTLKSERTGELVNTLLNGVDKLEDYFSKFLPQMFLSVFIPILILVFVFPLDWLTAIVFIVTAPIIPIFMFLIGSIAEKMNKKQWQTLSRMSAYFLDVLQGLPTLKLFNRTQEAIDKINDFSNLFRIKTLNVLKIAFLSALVLEVTATLSVAVIAVEIGLRLLNGNFVFSDALFILIIAPEFYLPLRILGTTYHAGMEGIAAFERIKDVLNYNTTKSNFTSNTKDDFTFAQNNSIILKNISYTYSDRATKALDNISLTIETNKVTAIVGASGSGKTTLMNILLRFFNPTEGNIFIGETDLHLVKKETWRENLAWLPQNPHLFSKSIRENLQIANVRATFEEVVNAAKIAHIHEFILDLPNGYNTLVGENGAKLSGGEIQRIALARAYLRNSPLLFVDEPTANLDPIVEEEIVKDMYKLFSGKTVLIIAHRLNTIIKADKIIVMKDGRIEESGNHNELILTNGYYKKLLDAHGEIIC